MEKARSEASLKRDETSHVIHFKIAKMMNHGQISMAGKTTPQNNSELWNT